jgi:diguanylate cyclase (GGDEF)-like protein/PAS domain S-box-containing protein
VGEFLRVAARRVRWPAWVLLIALGLVLPFALYAVVSQELRHEALDSARSRLSVSAASTAAGTSQVVDGTAAFFDAVDAAVDASEKPNVDARLRAELRSYVIDSIARSPIVQRVFLFDERGEGVDFVNPEAASPLHASAALLSAVSRGGFGAIGLARGDDIDELSRSGGVLVTRIAEHSRGRFRHVVLWLHQSRLRDLFEAADPGPHGIVLLLDKDGRLLVSEPSSAQLGAKNAVALPAAVRRTLLAPAAEAGFAALDDGVARYYRLVAVPKSDASVVVGIASEDIAAGFAEKLSATRWAIGIAWLLALAGGLLLYLSNERARQIARRATAQTEAMKLLQVQHRAALDSAHASIAILDEHGTIVNVNQSWHEFAEANGYATPDHGVGRNYLELCAPESASDGTSPIPAGLRQGLEDVIAGRIGLARFEYACNAPGKQRWFEAYFTPLALGKGGGAVARHIDETARILAEQEARKDGAILAAIDAVLPVIIYQRIAKRGTWEYTFVNDRASEISGYSRSDAMRKDFILDALHPEDRERVVQSYAHVVAEGGGVWRGEFRCIARPGGVKWLRGAVYVGVRDGIEAESLGILHDVTDEMVASERAHFTHDHDDLTGLYSRAYFERAVSAALEQWVRLNRFFATVVLDVDGFHEVNEAYGMRVGDDLLRALGATLTSDIAGARDVARLNADKFGVIVEVETVEEALVLAADAVHALGRPRRIAGHTIALTVSAGVAVPRHFTDAASDLLHDADSALERARDAGGAVFRLYSDEMGVESAARALLKEQLQEALDRGEFELHYQPKVDLAGWRVIGCEALIRWKHPSFGFQAPGRFIPVAEQSGLIVPIGAWVIEEACRQYVAWREAGVPVVPIAVNVSAVQFARSDVFETIANAYAASGAPAGALDIEVTESLFIDCSSELVATLEKIHALGVEIGLDDFGTGFSSLGYLKQLPLGIIKADQSFVRGALENASDATIVRSIVRMTSELGLRVVAEGVETPEQLKFVRDAGCAEAQGYYFSPPLMASDFAWYLTNSRRLLAQKQGSGAEPALRRSHRRRMP